MLWRVYYSDGSTFDSSEGSPYDSPSDGVQIIIKPDPDNGRFVLAKHDYYWFDHQRQEWFGGDISGFFQHLRKPGPSKVLFGEFIANREYQKIINNALSDKDFPLKTARHPEEVF